MFGLLYFRLILRTTVYVGMLTIDLGTSTTFVSSISVMSGRPAPPGRRGSVKKESFKSDDDAPAIPVLAVEQLSAADRLKSEREEEMKRAMELRKKAIEDEALAEKQEKEARKTALAQERALEAQRADQQKQAELQSQQREQAAQKAALELKQKNLEEENARLAQIERSRVLAEEEKRQAAQRAEEARIQSETIRREAEVATKVAPKPVVEEQHDDVEFEREQERQRQALEDARKKRELAEAQRQADQLEVTRKQQQLEEQQRRMDEKLAKQKELLAETAAAELHAQEEARRKQDERRRQLESAQREQVAAQKAAEQAEIDRLRSEEEDRQRQALAALQREQEEHDAEVLRMEQERAAAAAEALRAEQAISQFENAALDEKRRRAEAQRQKRAMFLNEMDSFSTTFEAKTQVQEDSIKQEQEKHYELLGQQMKQVEDAKAELLAKEAAEKEQRRRAALATAQAALAVPVPLPAPAASKASADTYSIQLDAESTSRNLLGDLSSTLFTSASTSDALPMDTHTGEGSGESALAMEGDEEEAAGDSQELRVPTRIGSGKPKAKGPFKPAPVAVINAKATAAIQRYSEDEEEEGTGKSIGCIAILAMSGCRIVGSACLFRSAPYLLKSFSVAIYAYSIRDRWGGQHLERADPGGASQDDAGSEGNLARQAGRPHGEATGLPRRGHLHLRRSVQLADVRLRGGRGRDRQQLHGVSDALPVGHHLREHAAVDCCPPLQGIRRAGPVPQEKIPPPGGQYAQASKEGSVPCPEQ